MAGPYADPKLNAFVAQLATLVKNAPAQAQFPVGGGGVPFAAVGASAQPHFNLTPEQVASVKNASGGESLSQVAANPAALKILNQLESSNAKIGIQGGVPEQNQKRQGLVSRVFDILQRPMYATAEGAREAGEAAVVGKGIGNIASSFGHGALLGIEGKKKTDYGQVLSEISDLHAAEKKLGLKHGWFDHASGPKVQQALDMAKANPGMGGSNTGRSIIGLGLDIAGDPLTYGGGLGLVPKAGEALKLTEEAKNTLTALKSAEKLSPKSKDLITGALYSSGRMSQRAALAKEPKVQQIALDLAKHEGQATFDKTIAELSGSNITPEKLQRAAKLAGKKRQEQVLQQVWTNYNKIAETKIPRQLAVKFGGAKVPIPGTDLIAAAAKGAASQVPIANKAMSLFNDKFITKAGAFKEAHATKLSGFGQGMTEARIEGREIRRALNPLGKDGRTESWTAFLNGHASNQTVKLSSGHTMDAADWYRGQYIPIKLGAEELGLGPREFKRWLPHTLPVVQKQIKNVKGELVDDPNWLENSMKQWSVKDGGQAIWHLQNAFNKAKARQGIFNSLGGTFGVRMAQKAIPEQKALIKSLQNKGWRKVRGVPELQNHLFDPETAKYVEHIGKELGDDRGYNKFFSTLARINKPIKFALTLPNPSFHWHNAIGDAFVNHLDNVGIGHYAKSLKILRNRNKFFETYDPTENRYPLFSIPGDPLENARTEVKPEFDGPIMGNRWKLRSEDGNIHKNLTQAELYAGYNHFGLRQNYSQELGFNESSPMGHFKNAIDHIQGASEAREDYFRLAHFIALIDKNPSKANTLRDAMEFAARRVRETHFDYTDFTKFEKEVMSQLIPFYKWSRKAFPLMMQVMLTQPGKAVLVPKVLRALSTLTGNPDNGNDVLPNLDEAVVPKWMRDSGYVPMFGYGGMPHEGYLSNPFSDLFTQQMNGVNDGTPNLAQMVLGQATPLIKDPLELILNKNTFTGGKVFNTDPGKPGIPSQLMQYLISQVPATNAVNRTIQQKQPDPLISWAGPLSLQADTPQRQKSELVRQRDVANAIMRELKYKNRNSQPSKPGKLPSLKSGKLGTLK